MLIHTLLLLLLAVSAAHAQPRIDGGFDVGPTWSSFDRLPGPLDLQQGDFVASGEYRGRPEIAQVQVLAWIYAPLAERAGVLLEATGTQRRFSTRLTLNGRGFVDPSGTPIPGGTATLDLQSGYTEVTAALHAALNARPLGIPVRVGVGPYAIGTAGARVTGTSSSPDRSVASYFAERLTPRSNSTSLFGPPGAPLGSGFGWGLSATLRATLFRYGTSGVTLGLRAAHDLSSPIDSGRRARSISALMGVTL